MTYFIAPGLTEKMPQRFRPKRYPYALFDAIEKEFGITTEQLKERNRKNEFAHPRQLFCFIACKIMDYTEESVATFIKRDRTTVNYNYKKIISILETEQIFNLEPTTLNQINNILRVINEDNYKPFSYKDIKKSPNFKK